jgi:hypothetical protein
MKKLMIVAALALTVASSALAATGPGSRDDNAKARKGHAVKVTRHARRAHHRAEAEHARRHDDSLLRSSKAGTVRHAEPGDDNGAGREAEPGDDRGQAVEPGDDNGAGREAEPGDDRGQGVEPGDDNGGGGEPGHGGGGDDGSGHH